jgi:hypothetical protein
MLRSSIVQVDLQRPDIMATQGNVTGACTLVASDNSKVNK